MAAFRDIAIASTIFFCCCSVALATDAGPNISVFGLIVLAACLPALLLVPFCIARVLFVYIRARRDGTLPAFMHWSMTAALISLVPWIILALAFVPGMQGLLSR